MKTVKIILLSLFLFASFAPTFSMEQTKEQEKKQSQIALLMIGHAISENNSALLERILEQHPSLANKPISETTTPLHAACEIGNPATVKVLLEKGAQRVHDENNNLPITYLAYNKGNQEEIEEIITLLKKFHGDDFDIDYQGNTVGITSLHEACTQGTINVVRALIAQGADKDRRDTKQGCSALHNAILHKHEKIARLLVNLGANINCASNQLTTPLHNALANNCSLRLVQFLVERGANVNAVDYFGNSPLHHTCACSSPTAYIATLVEKGADINRSSNSGITPLMFCVFHGNLFGIQELLRQGAKHYLTDRHGLNALDYAIRCKKTKEGKQIIQLLVNQGCKLINDKYDSDQINENLLSFARKCRPQIKKTTATKKKKKHKKKKKRSRQTYAQRQEKQKTVVQKESPTYQAKEIKPVETSAQKPTPRTKPIAAASKKIHFAQLKLHRRILHWNNKDWRQNHQQEGQQTDRQYHADKYYHTLPREILNRLFSQGKKRKYNNGAQAQDAWELEGEMIFHNAADNPWNPGLKVQRGYYHMTMNENGQIYHAGFKPYSLELFHSENQPNETIKIDVKSTRKNHGQLKRTFVLYVDKKEKPHDEHTNAQ